MNRTASTPLTVAALTLAIACILTWAAIIAG